MTPALPTAVPSWKYTIRDLTPLLGVALIATAAAAAGSPQEAPEAAAPRVVVLRVVDRLDRPVTAVSSCLLPECTKVAASATPDGLRVELPADAKKPGPRALRLEAPGFATAETEIPAAGNGPMVVRMRATGSVRASFLSPDEKREESFLVTLTPAPAGPGERPGRTIAEKKVVLPPRPKSANVSFDDVPAGTWALAWGGPGLANGVKAVTVGAAPASAGAIAVLRGITVEGAVRDDLGGPVAGARVFVSEGPSRERTDPFSASVVTAADGGFVVTGAPDDTKLLWTALAPGHMQAKGSFGGEARLEIVVERAQRVTGRVVDPDGRPVPEAQFVVRYVSDRSSRNHVGKIEVDGDGAFSFFREMPMKTRVQVRAKGLRQATRDLEPLPETGWPREFELGEIALEKGRALRGRVVETGTGVPASGVALKTTVAKKEGRSIVLDEQEATSDDDGRFEISGIPPKEPVALSARKGGYAPRNLDLGEADDDVEVLLGRGGRVEGRLCGRPFELSRSEIWMKAPGNVNSRDGAQKVDASGRFVFTGVETGSRTFTRAWLRENPLQPGSYGAALGDTRATVVVEEGRTVTVSLGCDGIPLSGVVLREGKPLPDWIVFFSGPAGAAPDAMTDASGRFSLFVPAPGSYEPDVDLNPAPGMTWAPVACHVPPGGLEGCLLDFRPVPAQEKP